MTERIIRKAPPLSGYLSGGRPRAVDWAVSALGTTGVPVMRIVRFTYFCALAMLPLLFGVAMALRLTRASNVSVIPSDTIVSAPINSPLTYPSQQVQRSAGSLFAGNGAQTNVLELPKASTDFVGDWGGYTHSSIERISPDLVGASPDRVSVIFGRQGDTVFMASELYSSASQTIVRRPAARILNRRMAVIEYESEDSELYYVCAHRFRLEDSARISYRSTVDVYGRQSHRLMGIVTQRATLKRLLTLREQLLFARPSRHQIPRAEISSSETFAPY